MACGRRWQKKVAAKKIHGNKEKPPAFLPDTCTSDRPMRLGTFCVQSSRWFFFCPARTSPAMQWHYIQSFAVILVQKFCNHDFCRWISLTGSTLLSSAVCQKLFFFKVHIFVTHPHKHFSQSITKKCHRHVHRPPATILHSMTNCAIGSQSFLLQISFLANFEGKMLLSKRRWTRCTLWTRFSEPPTRRKVRKKALKTFTQLARKDANMRSRCSDCEQEGKDTFFFDFGGRFLDRWCSFSLVLFPSAIYSCQGDLATCFTCLYQSKASQKNPRGVAPWPSCMHADFFFALPEIGD